MIQNSRQANIMWLVGYAYANLNKWYGAIAASLLEDSTAYKGPLTLNCIKCVGSFLQLVFCSGLIVCVHF